MQKATRPRVAFWDSGCNPLRVELGNLVIVQEDDVMSTGEIA